MTHKASSINDKKEVLLDVTRLFGRALLGVTSTGVDRVTLEYIRHYHHLSRAVLAEGRFVAVLTKSDSLIAFENLLKPTTFSRVIIKYLIVKARLTAWYRIKAHEKILINTAHSGVGDVSYASELRRRGVKFLFMVHDLIPITHPEFCRPNEKMRHQERIKNILTLGDGVVANSQHTLQTLEMHAFKLKLKLPVSIVAHLATGFTPRIRDDNRPYGEPYFVALGTIEPRKNHNLLFSLWRKLVVDLGHNAPKLVVVGRRGWECENAVDILERSEMLRGFLIEKNSCSDEELGTILQHAQALLFPTLVEGYGMPIIESLMVDTPVIATDLSVFHEIAGEIPDYLDPLDGVGWLSHIKAYMDSNNPLRLAQLERMKSFEMPTWKSHFEKVDALIDEVVGAD